MDGLQVVNQIKSFYNFLAHHILKKERPEPENHQLNSQLETVENNCMANIDTTMGFTIFPAKNVMFSFDSSRSFKDFVLGQGIEFFIDKPPNQEQIFNLVTNIILKAKIHLLIKEEKTAAANSQS